MSSTVAGHRNLTTTNWEPSLKLILLQLHEKLWRVNTDHSVVIWHLKQIGKVKSSISGCPVSWHRVVIWKCLLLLFYPKTRNRFSIGLWCATKSGFYTTTSNNQLSGWMEKKLKITSQSQTCTQKKVTVTVWWSAARLIHYNFLNPGESNTSEKHAQQINMHQKLQCLQPALVNRMGPILLDNNAHTVSASKVELTGLQSFASSAIFTWSLTNWLPLLQASQQLFAGKMLPQPPGCTKCFLRVHQILKHDFYPTGISKLISHLEKYVDWNGFYFD